ncbi:peptidase domain-containing ABC transporter [Dyella sp. 2RAF44]|uniref:peptidase domain-containing ABC transporter n=1 Tax=Dyella sp. 2RAF44 TaxID=3233000 RepID=UPI003F900058
MPMIRQTEAAECGLACVAMIAAYHGQHHSLQTLRRRFATSLKGMTLTQLLAVAHGLGLNGNPVRLELDEMRQLSVPCILHWDLNHFVVLHKATARDAVIHDPAAGERRLSYDELSKHFTGVAIELFPCPTFERKAPATEMSLRALTGSVSGLKGALLTVFALALALELFGLLGPQFMQITVDNVIADGDHDLLMFLSVSFLVLLVWQVGLSAVRSWTVVCLSTRFNLQWTANVFQHLLRLPQAYFLKRHLGDVVSRFGAIGVIQQTLTTRAVEVVLDGIMASLTLVMLLLYSPLLTALTVAGLALYGLFRALTYRFYREKNLEQVVLASRQQSQFMEAVRGVQTIRLFNQVPQQSARFINATTNTLNVGVQVQQFGLVYGSLQGLLSGALRIGLLGTGARLALDGQFSAGMLMAFLAYSDQFISRASNLVDYAIELRMLRIQAERLADIVMTPTEADTDGTYIGPLPAPSLSFDCVSFRYADGEPWVVNDCSFHIEAGRSVALTGPSGCGKSTLARLMLGLVDPDRGHIYVGGIPLKSLGKSTFRQMVGCVMQDDALIAGSVADNISFFAEDASQTRIEQAARLAQIHDDIAAMPMGYHTLCGDMGAALSGGQRQRLLLARALYRKPHILILDEATSHLDVACERRINAMLRELNITRIYVAHRPETIAAADYILAVEDGRTHETECAQPEERTSQSEFAR